MQRMQNESAMKKGHRAGLAARPLCEICSAAERWFKNRSDQIRDVIRSQSEQLLRDRL